MAIDNTRFRGIEMTVTTNRTHYDVLGITSKAPQEIVAAVYRAWMQALKCHPDLGGDEELAKAINIAYETLKDPVRRASYDKKLLRAHGEISMEKARRAPRTVVDSPIAYCPAPGRDWHSARAVDASCLGLKIRARERIDVGMHLAIAFPTSAGPAIEARVRWSKHVGSGMDEYYEAGAEFFEPQPNILNKLKEVS